MTDSENTTTRLQDALRAVDAAERLQLPPASRLNGGRAHAQEASRGMATEGFEPLAAILVEAYDQAAHGKGRTRHSRDLPFNRQPIMELQRMVGPGFAAGQAMKKVQEAMGMISRGDKNAAIDELLGAIVYAAATIVMIREMP